MPCFYLLSIFQLKQSAEKEPLSLIMRPVDSIDARSRDAADLLDYLRTKLEKTRAANEELQEKNSCLTSQLEVTTVKVAEVESARATINLAYSRLKVVSDGQARKIDDLEEQLMKLSASGKKIIFI
jgi:predicted nuclease with TOPRIM domain